MEDLQQYEQPSFERPIPGESLTTNPENPMPFEKGFKISNLSDGINTLFLKITEEDNLKPLLDSIQAKVPITDLVHYMLFEGFRKGMWNPDMMLLLAEPAVYMLVAFSERASIDYVLYAGEEEEEEESELTEEDRLELNRKFSSIIQKQIQGGKRVTSLPAEIQERLESFEIPEEFEEPSLMARTEESI